MNKIIIILIFFCCSCKDGNNVDYDIFNTIDTTRIDSNSINNDNFEIDNQLKQMQEIKLSHDEVMQLNTVEDYENFIRNNPKHKKIENVKAKLFILKKKKFFRNK